MFDDNEFESDIFMMNSNYHTFTMARKKDMNGQNLRLHTIIHKIHNVELWG